MQTILETMPQLAAYHPALMALAILCLAVLVQSFLAGILGLAGGEEISGLPLKGDHSKFSFRTIRTYGNSTENLPAFATTVFLAIIAGVGVALVNWLAIIHVVIRLAYWAVYYSGIGNVAGGMRTIMYVLGLFANIALAVLTVWALFA